jgi:hypothetical protein
MFLVFLAKEARHVRSAEFLNEEYVGRGKKTATIPCPNSNEFEGRGIRTFFLFSEGIWEDHEHREIQRREGDRGGAGRREVG